MATVAVGNALEQAGLVLLARLGYQLVGHLADGHHIHPIDALAGHVVGAGLTPDLGHARGAADGRSHPVLVVDTNEHDREVPELGHVERLVEGTDVGGAVPEYAHHDLVALLVVDGVATAHRQRERLADDGIAAVETVLLAEEVHGPAPPA